jgi:ribosomal-protein-alanine N-acetyltransferase
LESGESFRWAITVEPNQTVVGIILANPSEHGIELGYALSRAEWGSGYMAEAVQAVADWAMAQDSIHRVWALCLHT